MLGNRGVVTKHYGQATPLAAFLTAELFIREKGLPLPSPLEYIASARTKPNRVEAGIIPFTKLTVKDLLPGLKLRAGSSLIEITRILPTTKEVVYRIKARNSLKRMDAKKFIQLANQQGYRKVWDLASFLRTLKNLLSPILAAIPLMWVLKLIINTIRKKPIKFSQLPPKETI